jgi:hypothetical protein
MVLFESIDGSGDSFDPNGLTDLERICSSFKRKSLEGGDFQPAISGGDLFSKYSQGNK